MAKQIPITFVWKLYLLLWAEGDKLRAEGDKLWAEGDKLRAEGSKLWAEGGKLWAEGVLEAYGNVTIEWHSATSCTVDGTEKFNKETV